MTLISHALAFALGAAVARKYPVLAERVAGWIRQIKRR